MKENKIHQPAQVTVRRSQVRLAPYNPRVISDDARKKLRDNMRRVGLLGGVVWNSATGNLVSGHQRVAIMDAANRYDPANPDTDYEFRVEEVRMDERTEKEQNLFMNNRSVQGTFDDDLLRRMLSEIDYTAAGFDDTDMQLLGLSDFGGYDPSGGATGDYDPVAAMEAGDKTDEQRREWTVEGAVAGRQDLAEHDALTRAGGENPRLDRSTDFYNDTEANQIARHNEVRAVKERIANTNDENRDGGALSYVVISFATPAAKANFLLSYGYDPAAKYVAGEEFANKLEFGDSEE